MKRPLLPEARAGVGAAFVLLCLVLAAEVADGVDANYVGLLAAAPFLAAAFSSWPEVLAVGVLVEVPVMLSVCRFCVATRGWFAGVDPGGQVAAAPVPSRP